MNPITAAKAATRPRAIAALTVAAGLAIAAGAAAAPAAHAARADNPAPLSAKINDVIARDRLPVQVNNGWEAVTGPADRIGDVRSMAASLSVGDVVEYTGEDQTGQAILIFTGNDTANTAFQVTGAAFHSVADDTDQTWYVYDDSGKPDANITPGSAENMPAVDATLANFNVTLFSFSPSVTMFSF